MLAGRFSGITNAYAMVLADCDGHKFASNNPPINNSKL
jgi:hypothetical protein